MRRQVLSITSTTAIGQELLLRVIVVVAFVAIGVGVGVGGASDSNVVESNLILDSSSALDIENILHKPYEQVCEQDTIDESSPELHVDQTRPECPLPLNSSSRQTGCLCDFDSTRIDCIYADRLARLPLFSASFNNTNGGSVNGKQTGIDGNGNESSSSSSSSITSSLSNGISWSIDLRCKNISHLDGFEFVTNLTHINMLDLSGLTSVEYFKWCKFANTSTYFIDPNNNNNNNTNKLNKTNHTESAIRYLERVGVENKTLPKTKQKDRLKLGTVNLSSNRIRAVHLLGEPVHIHRLLLAHNHIATLGIRTHLDVCALKLDTLNLSFNRFRQIDIGYLIFLRALNISHNQLGTFGVDFYDTREFFAYSRNVCQLNYTTHGNIAENQYVLESNLVEIDFTDNLLASLPLHYLKNVAFHKLEKLVVAANQLKSIGHQDLSGLHSLKHLSLRSNAIDNLDENAFVDLKQLKFLDLSVNFLQTIPNGLFTSQERSLETLLMTHNYLEAIPRRAFRHLASLRFLSLNCNRIRAIQNYSFGYMSSLAELSLTTNAIDSIEPEAFSIDKSSMLGPGLIEKLDLSGNRLVALNQTVFFYLTNLRHLVLSNNKIKFIDRKVFRGIGLLITLDLSFNQLNNLDFLANRNFSLVRYLALANNRLKRLRSAQFVFLKSLTHLDVSSNRISRIDDCAFSGLESSIRRVYLNYNRIRRLNSCAFAIDFRQLRFVQILANPLNCSHNCEFFYVIYNPPYSINYEGFECANVSATNFTHCTPQDFDLVYKKCRAKMRGDRNCTRLVAEILSAPVDEYGMLEKSSLYPSSSSSSSSSSEESAEIEEMTMIESMRASKEHLLDDEDESDDDEAITSRSTSWLLRRTNQPISLHLVDRFLKILTIFLLVIFFST